MRSIIRYDLTVTHIERTRLSIICELSVDGYVQIESR